MARRHKHFTRMKTEIRRAVRGDFVVPGWYSLRAGGWRVDPFGHHREPTVRFPIAFSIENNIEGRTAIVRQFGHRRHMIEGSPAAVVRSGRAGDATLFEDLPVVPGEYQRTTSFSWRWRWRGSARWDYESPRGDRFDSQQLESMYELSDGEVAAWSPSGLIRITVYFIARGVWPLASILRNATTRLSPDLPWEARLAWPDKAVAAEVNDAAFRWASDLLEEFGGAIELTRSSGGQRWTGIVRGGAWRGGRLWMPRDRRLRFDPDEMIISPW